MKRLLLLCFGIGMGSFLIGMDDWAYEPWDWLPVGKKVKVKYYDESEDSYKITTYKFTLPQWNGNNIAGKFCIDDEVAGWYEIIHEAEYNNAHLYTANYYPDNETYTLYHWHIKKKNGEIKVLINGGFTLPTQSDPIEPFQQHLQSLEEKKEKAQQWDSHQCPTDQEVITCHIQSDWGLWLMKTTEGKCISSIATLCALYGTGRLLWDTKHYWKKGIRSLLTLFKKRKRRKKYRRAQEVL